MSPRIIPCSRHLHETVGKIALPTRVARIRGSEFLADCQARAISLERLLPLVLLQQYIAYSVIAHRHVPLPPGIPGIGGSELLFDAQTCSIGLQRVVVLSIGTQ